MLDDAQEIARVVPAITAIRKALPTIPLSIDTYKAATARAAVHAGADVINDVWGAAFGFTSEERESWISAAEPGAPNLCHGARGSAMASQAAAELSCPLVLMHNRPDRAYTSFLEDVLLDLRLSLTLSPCGGSPQAPALAPIPVLRIREERPAKSGGLKALLHGRSSNSPTRCSWERLANLLWAPFLEIQSINGSKPLRRHWSGESNRGVRWCGSTTSRNSLPPSRWPMRFEEGSPGKRMRTYTLTLARMKFFGRHAAFTLQRPNPDNRLR